MGLGIWGLAVIFLHPNYISHILPVTVAVVSLVTSHSQEDIDIITLEFATRAQAITHIGAESLTP